MLKVPSARVHLLLCSHYAWTYSLPNSIAWRIINCEVMYCNLHTVLGGVLVRGLPYPDLTNFPRWRRCSVPVSRPKGESFDSSNWTTFFYFQRNCCSLTSWIRHNPHDKSCFFVTPINGAGFSPQRDRYPNRVKDNGDQKKCTWRSQNFV